MQASGPANRSIVSDVVVTVDVKHSHQPIIYALTVDLFKDPI